MTSQEYNYELKIPKERIAVLIGKKGVIKREIEASTKTKLNIDSKEGDVLIYGEDAMGIFTAREVIEAIARGLNPEFARLLLKTDYVLVIVDIKDFAGKNNETALRLKGRVIGKDGKSRKTIEFFTETKICVYGKTIGIIGKPEGVESARRAVESLLKGAPHGNVYKVLENKKRELTIKELSGEGSLDEREGKEQIQ